MYKNLFCSSLFAFFILGFGASAYATHSPDPSCPSILRVEFTRETRKAFGEVFDCQTKAIEKLSEQANSYGVEIDLETLRVSGWSSNLLAIYIWWTVDLKATSTLLPNGDRSLTKMTQKSIFRDCF